MRIKFYLRSYIYISAILLSTNVLLADTDSPQSSLTNPNNTRSSADSDTKTTDSIKSVKLPSSVVTTTSQLEEYQSGEMINESMIESNPSGNGDITSILRILPNVQFDNAQSKSSTPGEIDPANISISGGLYYQNNFQLDGFNMNNDLDPAGSQGSNPVAATALPGRSQGLNIDTSLLESIVVQDSNVSAAYGGFTGGVVEANTRRPTKNFGANVSYQITQGNADPHKFSLTNYHIYEANDQSYNNFLNSSSYGNQPEFIKHLIRSSIESKLNDKSGVIASFTTTQSFIPLNAYANTYMSTTRDDTRKTQKRQSYNFFIKGYYDPIESLRIEASYTYAPQYNEYFIVNTKDSDFYLQSGGHQAGIKALWENLLGLLTAQSNFNYMENSRSGSAQHAKGWRVSDEKNWSSDKNGTVSEGGYGNVDSTQLNLHLKLNQSFKPIELFSLWEHKINTGLEIGYVNASYERLGDTIFGGTAWLSPLTNGMTCIDEFCSTSPVHYQINTWKDNKGQFANKATLYKAGKINIDNFDLSLYAEDDMNFHLGAFGEINTRFGLRLDYDTYMNKAPIAPRLSLNYIAPWSYGEYGKNFKSTLIFGANRYYGRNLFTYALMDGRSSLQYTVSRTDPSTSWDNATKTQNKNDTNFAQLKVPYADELAVGISQQLYIFQAVAKYIHRFGRDEIRRACKDPKTGQISAYNCTSNVTGLTDTLRFVYTNDGQSDTDVITLSVQNIQPIQTFSIKHHYMLAFDWTNVKRNYADYSTNLTDDELSNQLISYDGKLIRYADRPAENFIRPYTLRLSTTHNFNIARTKWLWNNFFRYRAGYKTMASVREADKDSFVIDGVLTKVDTFKAFDIRGAFTWDMRIGFEVDVWKGNTLYMNLDIYNVLDSKNIAIASASYSATAGTTAIPVYEVGRQFWLQVGYKF
ncbi:TonB-dependent receptor [Helicobacter sp. MIT 05-5293]|uniref:TonB-dependent receptor n=1 Tax=Helicobacter sp. MIT 05-5293 TaxID=1548149 RepID=UPI0010FF2937|nr:TonB-dependent receptor [Helicobacter sp. MIT 05-5293]TLD80993.1 TonB-dependent receptor [Helicobacter sp. MIT 05-5293]